MKQVIATITVLGFFMSSTGFASVNGEYELRAKLVDSLKDLNKSSLSVNTKGMILTNIVTAYVKSDIEDAELAEKIVQATITLGDTLNRKNRQLVDASLARIK